VPIFGASTTSPRNPKIFVDDPGELYTKERCEAQAKEIVDPKAEDEGSSKSPKQPPPPSLKRDQLQSPPMGEQPQPNRKIKELCSPNIVDLPNINLQDIGRSLKIKISTIHMVQQSPFTGKDDLKLHFQEFVQLCQTFKVDGVTQDQMRERLFPSSLIGKAWHWFHTLPAESKQN
jgi:hypothetical protein